jgi:hypothetical protein
MMIIMMAVCNQHFVIVTDPIKTISEVGRPLSVIMRDSFWKLGCELKVTRRLVEPIFNCENVRCSIGREDS